MLDAKGLYRLEMRLSQYVGSRSFSKPQLTSEEHDVLKGPDPKRSNGRKNQVLGEAVSIRHLGSEPVS